MGDLVEQSSDLVDLKKASAAIASRSEVANSLFPPTTRRQWMWHNIRDACFLSAAGGGMGIMVASTLVLVGVGFPMVLITIGLGLVGLLFVVGSIAHQFGKGWHRYLPPLGMEGYFYTRAVQDGQRMRIELVEYTRRMVRDAYGIEQERDYVAVRFTETFASDELEDAQTRLEQLAQQAQQENLERIDRQLQPHDVAHLNHHARQLNRSLI